MAKCWGSAGMGNPGGAWDFTANFHLYPLKHRMPLSCSLKVGHGGFCHNEWGFLPAWQCPFCTLWILSPPVSWYWVVLEMLDDVSCSGSHHVLISSPRLLSSLWRSPQWQSKANISRIQQQCILLGYSIIYHCILAPWLQLNIQEMFYFPSKSCF